MGAAELGTARGRALGLGAGQAEGEGAFRRHGATKKADANGGGAAQVGAEGVGADGADSNGGGAVRVGAEEVGSEGSCSG